MREKDPMIESLISSAQMDAKPDASLMESCRARVLRECRSSPGDGRFKRTSTVVIGLGALLFCGLALGATESGRDLLRKILMPVKPARVVEWPSAEDGTGQEWVDEARAVSPEELTSGELGDFVATGRPRTGGDDDDQNRSSLATEMAELRRAGLGRLVSINEELNGEGSTYDTSYSIDYTMGDGRIVRVDGQRPSGLQAVNLHIDELQRLRDEGAGEVISYQESSFGMGNHTIRFTLEDGQTVDVETRYPPATREDREAVFNETRRLKSELRFTVADPRRLPNGVVIGLLRYELEDGRNVGLVERIPPEVVEEDGWSVAMPHVRPTHRR